MTSDISINHWRDWISVRNQIYDFGDFTLNGVKSSIWIDHHIKEKWIEVKDPKGKIINVSKIVPFVIKGMNFRFNPIELIKKDNYFQLEQRIYVTLNVEI